MAWRPRKTVADQNVGYFYFIALFKDGWFINGVWIFLLREYISYREMALLELIAISIGLLVEIPSGALADIIGRKKVAFIGQNLLAISPLLTITGIWHPIGFFIGPIFTSIGIALGSGSVEALVYDSLAAEKREASYPTVIGRSKACGVLALCGALILGGAAWRLYPLLPWLLCFFVFSLAAFFISRLQEPDFQKRSSREIAPNVLLDQMKQGFKTLFHKNSAGRMTALCILNFSYALWSWGLVRLLMGESYGYEADKVSYLLGVSFFVAALAVFKLDVLQSALGHHRGLLILFTAQVFLWSSALIFQNKMLWGALLFIVFSTTGKMAEAWVSIVINNHATSKERATALSIHSLLQQFFRMCGICYFFFAYGYERKSALAASSILQPLYLFMATLLLVGYAIFIFSSRGTSGYQTSPSIYRLRSGRSTKIPRIEY